MSNYDYLDTMWGYADPKYSTVIQISGDVPDNSGFGSVTQYNTLKSSYDSAQTSAKVEQTRIQSTISKFDGKLAPPTKMPPSEIQRIKDLKCPPPVQPSVVNAHVNNLNTAIKTQLTAIQILEQQVEDLEKRYKISFSVQPQPKYDLSSSQLPTITTTGSLTNIEIEFHLWEAREGVQGVRGVQGNSGVQPSYLYGNPGARGDTGYYGVKGNTMK